MTTYAVAVLQGAKRDGTWVTKCYKNGTLDHMQELSTPTQARSYAEQWLIDQIDNTDDD